MSILKKILSKFKSKNVSGGRGGAVEIKLPNGSRGLDISHHEKIIDWNKFINNYDFMILKATEGTNFIDGTFRHRWETLARLNIQRGAYHFFRCDKNPIEQAKHFLNTVGSFNPSDWLILDIETLDNQTIEEVRMKIKAFLNHIEKTTGKIPVFYSYFYFIEHLELGEEFSKYPLWVADYRGKGVFIPKPWKDAFIFQYSDKLQVPGINGLCDGNILLG